MDAAFRHGAFPDLHAEAVAADVAPEEIEFARRAEYLGANIAVLMMDNEFECPKCRNVLTQGARMCEACGLIFCKKCKIAPVVTGTEYCGQHQEPPPQFPQRRQVRKR